MKKNKAFTLIELLIVVAIIGILATVVILNVSGARAKAQDAKVKEDVSTVIKAAEIARNDGGLTATGDVIEVSKLQSNFFEVVLAEAGNLSVYIREADGTELIKANPKHPVSTEKYYFQSTTSAYDFAGLLSDKSNVWLGQTGAKTLSVGKTDSTNPFRAQYGGTTSNTNTNSPDYCSLAGTEATGWVAPHCSDNVQNCDETGTDTGGNDCGMAGPQ